jgi:hypothetical protein
LKNDVVYGGLAYCDWSREHHGKEYDLDLGI